MTRLTRLQRGVTLLEVMISVVVLSFGLLALTALQGSLIRASAETKAQTIALSLAKDKVEELRSFANISGYRDIPAKAEASAETRSLGGVDFKRWWDVTRYTFNPTSQQFEMAGVAGGVLAARNNEFKRIQVTVSWTDATGQARRVVVDDAVGAVDPGDSAKLAEVRSFEPRRAKAMIFNPAATEGVIPIAISSTDSTAATNPTPEVTGRGTRNERVVETRFDVLTYANVNNTSNKLAQSRVETSVVGCTCDTSTGGGDGAMRPAFWDGTRYAPPQPAGYPAPAGRAATVVPESRLCTICCRDHHDNSSTATGRVPSGAARFDPWRSTHDHFVPDSFLVANNGTVSATTVNSGSTRYMEACRIIRVDGLWRVAPDMRAEQVNLLETTAEAGVAARLPAPSATATTNYAGPSGFVLGYMNTRYVNGTSYNTAPANVTPNPALKPAVLNIAKALDYKWQHARGLYMDYLEPVAINRLNKAKTDCAAQNAKASGSCSLQATILSMLPFTSINLTEIANWRTYLNNGTESSDHIYVTMEDFLESLDYVQPVRGNVLSGFKPPNGNSSATPFARAEIFESNSGLALLLDPVDLDEYTPRVDRQDFNVSGNAPANSTGGYYSIAIPRLTNNNPNGYPFANSSASFPRFFSTPEVSRCTFATKGGTKPSPYTCANYNLGTSTTPRALTINATKYNYQDSSRTATTAVSCSGVDGPRSWSGPYPINVCRNFRVNSATSSRNGVTATVASPVEDGSVIESTSIAFSNVVDGDTLTVNLGLQSETTTGLTCTYQKATSANGTVSYTYFVVPDPCN